jgi:hypothetical protein
MLPGNQGGVKEWLATQVPSSQEYQERQRQKLMQAPSAVTAMQAKVNQTFTQAPPQASPRLQMEQAQGQNPYMQQHFNNQRQLVGQRFADSNRQATDAMQRRFASMGLQNSGASVAAIQQGQQQADRGREEAMMNLGGQEAQANQAYNDAITARNFQREGTNYQSQLADQAANNPISRLMQQLQAQGAVNDMDMAYKKFGQEESDNWFNRYIAKKTLESQGGLLGGGGFLGTGL